MSSNPTATEHDERRRIVADGIARGQSKTAIAARLGISRYALRKWCALRGVDIPPGRGSGPWPAHVREAALAASDVGESAARIAQRLDVSVHTVAWWITRHRKALAPESPVTAGTPEIIRTDHGWEITCPPCGYIQPLRYPTKARALYVWETKHEHCRPAPAPTACECVRVRHTHGTCAMYDTHWCRCGRCRAANADAVRESRTARRQGRGGLVDGDRVRAHLRELEAAGWTWPRVAVTAGVGASTISDILHGRHPGDPDHHAYRPPRPAVRRATAERLFAVTTTAPPAPAKSRPALDPPPPSPAPAPTTRRDHDPDTTPPAHMAP